MKKFSYKDSVMTAKYFSAVDMKTGKTLWFSRSRSPQHLYPLTEKDYYEAIKYAVQHGLEQMPILSVSSKDFPYCDYDCLDCLACPSREWAIKDHHIKYPIVPIEKYKKILDEISAYSARRGFNKVRFEVCGEGNPDLYKHRIEMLEHANQKCNMGLVYVSTGSQISNQLLDCLVENADFIRISFPGISTEAYRTYSNQKSRTNQFSYDDAIRLLEKLGNARAKAGREDSLLIGTRTCIRPLNAGHYDEFIHTIADVGVDVFQGVKVLIPDFESVKSEYISQKEIEELVALKETAYSYGLKDYQIPTDLNTVYTNRALEEKDKPTVCWSSLVSPPLYGTNLMSCVLWDRITNLNYHYGIMEGNENELENMMHGERARFIMSHCPKDCTECCSFKDNNFMESLWRVLKSHNNLDDVKFITNY